MISLPKTTEFNRRIPKQIFYENLSVMPELKRIFIDQICASMEGETWSVELSLKHAVALDEKRNSSKNKSSLCKRRCRPKSNSTSRCR